MRRMIPLLIVAVLTARIGTITFQGHKETWYNLRMDKVVERTDNALGVTGFYWERDDGVKMYGPWVIVAADWSVHPHYSFVETSLGQGIVLDTHTTDDKELIDIATNWK